MDEGSYFMDRCYCSQLIDATCEYCHNKHIKRVEEQARRKGIDDTLTLLRKYNYDISYNSEEIEIGLIEEGLSELGDEK